MISLVFTFLTLGTLKAQTSELYNDQKSQIKNELQNNQTTFVTEADENFQDQRTNFSVPVRCNQEQLVYLSYNFCGEAFHQKMMNISKEKCCILENIIRPYNELTLCLEALSHMVDCYYPNPDIQDFFLYIHSTYFHNCTKKEFLLEDAPHGLVITLTLIPVSLIPILVYLVIWKSKIQE